MKIKSYNNYKNVDLGWLSEIPHHWKIQRNKDIFFEVSEKSKEGKELLLTVSHLTGVTPRKEKTVNMFFADSMEGYKLCKKEDLIINTMWAWMGALGVSKHDGICSPAYGVYRGLNLFDFSSDYLEYLFTTPNYIMEMTRYSKGIVSSRLRLYPWEFFQINSIIPPIETQKEIVRFLKLKTKQIDNKINLLSRKKSTLNELRKAIISEIIYGGTNKNAVFKKSKIEGIESIPKHWNLIRLKDISTISTSSVNKKIEEGEDLVSLVNYTDVYNSLTKEIRNSSKFMIVSANKLQINDKKLCKGDLLITPSSETIEDIGVSAVVMEDLENTLYSYHLLRIRFSIKLDLKFIKYLFNNHLIQYYFSKSAQGTTRPILGLNVFNSMQIPLPPYEEQVEIANILEEKTSKIDKIISKIDEQINTLTEFRKILINDVVTGKMRVAE